MGYEGMEDEGWGMIRGSKTEDGGQRVQDRSDRM